MNSSQRTTTKDLTWKKNADAWRVCIVQELMPHYRLPLFDRMAGRPDICLSVWSDERGGRYSLEPVKGSGRFQTRHSPTRRLGPFNWQPDQHTAVESGDFDVVIFLWNSRFLNLSRSLKLARKRGVRTILWGHGVSKRDSRLRRAIRNRLLSLADAALVYNHDAASRLIDDGFAKNEVFVALNAIDQTPIREAIDYWNQRPDELREFQDRHGIMPGKLLVYISRLESSKRADILIDAFAEVSRNDPSFRLAIIGAGSFEATIRERVSAHDLENSVIFTGALYEEKQIAPWCLSAACFPYPAEIGLSVLHAFGYGLPVITSDLRSSHGPEIEALRDGENGLLYWHGETSHFAKQILRCLRDDQLRTHLAEKAAQTVVGPEGFTLDRMVCGFLNAIRNVTRNS